MRIGILGGGQLAMMMIEKSSKHNIEFMVLDPSERPPASRYVNCIKSQFNDEDSLDKLIDYCDIVTIDFENVPANTPKTINKPKVLTILKSTALYSMCVFVEIIDVGIIIASEVPTDKCILVKISNSRTLNA